MVRFCLMCVFGALLIASSFFEPAFNLVYSVLGMGISWLLGTELQRTRLLLRLRFVLRAWFRSLLSHKVTDQKEAPAPGVTFSLLEYVAPKQGTTNSQGNTSCDFVSTIVSPKTALTCTLWITTICLHPHYELKLGKSHGLEFFHVLKGKGKWGTEEPKRDVADMNRIVNGNMIQQGDAFFVEANR